MIVLNKTTGVLLDKNTNLNKGLIYFKDTKTRNAIANSAFEFVKKEFKFIKLLKETEKIFLNINPNG